MQPIDRLKKVHSLSCEADTTVSEAPQAKKGRQTLTLLDLIKVQNWSEVKSIFERSNLRQKILFLSEIGKMDLSHSAIVQLNEILTPFQFSTFLADFKVEPNQALLKHLKGCSTALGDLKAESFCNKVQELNKQYQLKPDARFFAHVFGDFIIGRTSFEGLRLSLTTQYLLKCLEIVKDLDPHWNSNIHLQAALIQIRALEKESTLMEQIGENFTEKALDQWAEGKIEQLKQTGILYLKSGYVGIPNGHAIVACIQKKNSGYSLSLFNTGDGLEYHPSRIINGKRKYCTVAEWESLSKEDVENKMFFRIIFGMAMLNLEECTTVKPRADNLYLPLIALAGEPKNLQLADDQFMTSQRSGTCSWKCLMALLRNSMPANDYKKLKLQIRMVVYALTDTRILTDYSPYFPQTQSKIFRSINKLFEGKIISPHEMFQAFLVFNSKSMHTDRIHYKAGEIKPGGYPSSSEEVIEKKPPPEPVSPPFGAINPLPPFLIQPWSLANLDQACTYMEELVKEFRLPELRLIIKLVFAKLPQVNENCWKNMSFSDIEQCSNHLLRLVILLKDSELEFSAEKVVNSYYLYQLHDMLVRDYMCRKAGCNVFGNARMLLKEMTQVLDIPLSTTDPVVIDRMHNLAEFLKESSDERDFIFQLQTDHIGTLIHSFFDCDEKYEKGFNLILKKYLVGIGEKENIPESDSSRYESIFSEKSDFPSVFWNLFHHFCFSCTNDLPSIEELECEINGEPGELFFAMKLWNDTDEENRPLSFDLPKQLEESEISSISKMKLPPFFFQVPTILDRLAAKNEILSNQEMELLTVSLFQKGIGEDDVKVPIEHECYHGSRQLLISRLLQILKKQLKFVVFCGDVKQLVQLYEMSAAIDHYTGNLGEIEFKNLFEYTQIVSFYDQLKENQKVEGGLFFLRYCIKANLINSKFLEVYIRTFFKTHLSYRRDQYVACCHLGMQVSHLLSLQFEQHRNETEQLLKEITGIEAFLCGNWPELKMGGYTFNFCNGLQLSPSGEAVFHLKYKAEAPQFLQDVLLDKDFPLCFKLEGNQLVSREKGVALEYYKNCPPFEIISGHLLQRLTSQSLPVLCAQGYTKNEHMYSGTYKWSANEKKVAWFARNGSHAYLIRSEKEVLLYRIEKGQTKQFDVLRGLARIASIPPTIRSKLLRQWSDGAESIWYHPKNHQVHFLKDFRFIWDPIEDVLRCEDYSDYRIAEKQLTFVSMVLEKSPQERLFILSKFYKNKTFVLKSDPEIESVEKSIVGPPNEMMVLIRHLIEKNQFLLAHYYYKKLPKLLHDALTWQMMDEIIINSRNFKTNNPDFYALLVFMVSDLLENRPQLGKNHKFNSLNKFENIYDSYVQNYSNVTNEMRLSQQQEEFIQSHFVKDPFWNAHLDKIKVLSRKNTVQVDPEGLVNLQKTLNQIQADWLFYKTEKSEKIEESEEVENSDHDSEEDSQDGEVVKTGGIIPPTKIEYYFDQVESKNLISIAQTLIAAISQNNRELKIHAIALLASYKRNHKESDGKMAVYNTHLFWLLLKLARCDAFHHSVRAIKVIVENNPDFTDQLNQLFAFVKQQPEMSISHKTSSKSEALTTPPVISSPDAIMTAQPAEPLLRVHPFLKDFENFFEEEPSIAFTIKGLLSTASVKTDKAGQFLLHILEQHSTTEPNRIFRLKEGKRIELRKYLEDKLKQFTAFFEQELLRYNELKESSFEKDFTSHLHRQVKVLGGIEKKTSLDTLLEDYFLHLNILSGERKTLVQSIICLQLHIQLCRLTIKALNEGNDLSAAQMLRSGLPQFNGNDDYRVRVQSFYQIISNKLFREKQWEVFELSSKYTHSALQIDCGQGKTKVITVALALEQLMHKKLLFNIVPSGNAEVNVCDLVSVISPKTPFRVRHFEVVRSFKTDVHNLQQFTKLLALNEQEGVALVSIPQTIQSFLLKYFEVLIEPISANEISEHEDRLCLLEESLERIMDHSRGILDEGHEVLSPKRTLNFTINSEEQGIPVERHQDVVWLFDAMGEAKSLGYHFPVGSDNTFSWTPEYYHAEQRSFLADVWSQLFPEEEQAAICSILEKRQEELSQSDKAYFYSKDRSIQDRLLLMRAQLHHYLPYTLNLRCCVHYGPLAGVKEAVPYDYNQSPLKNSKFQNPDIAINLSLQQTYQLDLTKEQVKELISIWQKTGYFNEEIRQIFPNDISSINLENSEVLEHLHATLKKNPLFKREYARQCILPSVLLQDERLSSNAQDLGALFFPQLTSFTGTLLSNILMLPARMHYALDGNADADMLRTFLQGDHVQISEESVISLLHHPSVSMVLDPNAYYEGRFNKDVATSLLAASPESVTAIEYFDDESNLLKRLTRANKQGRVITYCDQKHTTGTDTVQPKDGVGLLIVHKGMTWTDLIQAAKRLRQLGRGQKVILVISSEMKDQITSQLPDGEFDKNKIFLWACLNEGATIGSHLTLSLQQQLHGICRRRLMHKLIRIRFEENSYEKRMALVNAYRSLIVEKVNNHEYREHGSIEPAKNPFAHFSELVENYKIQFRDLLTVEDLSEINTIMRLAESFLSNEPAQAINDRLNMHMQTEKREVRFLSEDTENGKDKEMPLFDNAETVLKNRNLLEPQSLTQFDLKFYLSAGVDPKLGLDKRLMFTSRLLFKTLTSSTNTQKKWAESLKDHRFDLYFPKIEYIMELADRGRKRYFTIVPKEADVFRQFAHTQIHKSDYVSSLVIFNTEGQSWLDYGHKANDERDRDLISAQVRFINAEVRYTPNQFVALKNWLKEGNLDAKIAFFISRQTHLARTDESIRYRDPGMMQALFNECRNTGPRGGHLDDARVLL